MSEPSGAAAAITQVSELQAELNRLRADVALLQAEAGARRTLGRYMRLCDVPRLMTGASEEERAQAIAALFMPQAIWEGVGGAHGAQFGSQVGREAIAAHFLNFYTRREPLQVFNTHYLCTESLEAADGRVTGDWVQFQPWVDVAGGSLLRSSRLNVTFEQVGEEWLIAHYRTENLFIAALPDNWWSSLIARPALEIPRAD
ncbi:nuclear transport factor 2 family protein [Novosphingobium sp.]|uniref:nuclear transport factor 2 family protein n=1 Tax=Novosphingobium sp. TaxID=1874826 RepID=UPI002FE187F9